MTLESKLRALVGELRKPVASSTAMNEAVYNDCADRIEALLAETQEPLSLNANVQNIIERAKGWTESDLRKYPTATLELIDELAARLKALAAAAL